jgi:hypothetical protein
MMLTATDVLLLGAGHTSLPPTPPRAHELHGIGHALPIRHAPGLRARIAASSPASEVAIAAVW